MFEKGNANWLSELPSVTKKYNNTIHHSTKMKTIAASMNSMEKYEKQVYSKLQDKRKKHFPKIKLGQFVGTADNKKVFSKGDSTNWSYKLFTKTEVIHDTIPSYGINFLPERYNENSLLPTKLSLEENNKVMKKLTLIQ